jgi:hypothetical protein
VKHLERLLDRTYFACHVRLNDSDAFVIWYQDERDGFIRQPDERLVVAKSIEDLEEAAARIGSALAWEQPTEYDFDRLRDWCRHPSAETVECAAFLNAWNFFDDLARIHENPHSSYANLSRKAAPTYDRLFWGNELPSVTPPDERYCPDWSADDL